MKHILLLEDDQKIASQIVQELELKGFSVTHAKLIEQTKLLALEKFDLAIFDWNLPDGESIDLVKNMREQHIQTPVIMLTANTEPEYRNKSTQFGANDFLGKPFYFHELLARVEVLTVQSNTNTNLDTLSCSGIKVYIKEMKVTFNDQTLYLTKKEFDLLIFFIKNPKMVFSRNEIIDSVWGKDENPSHRTVDTHILHLRKKINSDLFETVWSTGYRYVPNS